MRNEKYQLLQLIQGIGSAGGRRISWLKNIRMVWEKHRIPVPSSTIKSRCGLDGRKAAIRRSS